MNNTEALLKQIASLQAQLATIQSAAADIVNAHNYDGYIDGSLVRELESVTPSELLDY